MRNVSDLMIEACGYCRILILSILIFNFSAQAQETPGDQKFRSFSTRMGLASNTQLCMAQDHEGFLWIGTADGLNRFDGHTFKVYRTTRHDPNSLQSNVILSLCVDKTGVLWIGTSRGGLSRYNKEHDNFTTYRSDFDNDETLASDVVTSIVEDKNEQLWIGTYEGLNLFNRKNEQFKRYKYSNPLRSDGLAFNQISTVTADDSLLWIGYYSGTISAFNVARKKFSHYTLFNATDRNVKEFMVTSSCVNGDSVWLSTWGKGTWIFDKKTHTFSPFAKDTYPFVNAIFKDAQKNLWIGTESDGLLYFEKRSGKITHYTHDDFDKFSLSENCVSAIFQDSQGNLWIGNKKGSLHYLNTRNSFQGWRKNSFAANGLMSKEVSSVLEDRKHRLWIGYVNGGIEIIDLTGARRKITIYGKGAANLGTINDIYESRDGTIWVSTFLRGLQKYDERPGKFFSFEHDPADSTSIACNNVRQITEDDNGNLWLALHGGGLSVVNPAIGKFRHYKVNYRNISKTICSDWLLSVLIDHHSIWVGSVSGVSVLNTQTTKIVRYKSNPASDTSLSNDNANVIFKDSKGFIWVGTNNGLTKISKSGKFLSAYFTADGLPHNTITGILEDDHYNLWISTSRGLSKFSPEAVTFRNYFTEDGLETDEFIVNSCFKNSSGQMYFGGREGLCLFHPDSLQDNDLKPPVYITDFKLFNQSVPVQSSDKNIFSFSKQIMFLDEITLAYDQNIIGFDFAVLDYLNPHKSQYAYKLEGFDKDWTYAGARSEAVYTNLHPGEYTFEVKASTGDGVWPVKGASVRVIVASPYWRTGWAYAAYTFLAGLFLYLFWILVLRHATMVKKLEIEELEIKKLQALDAQKMDFFSNVSHEFRTPLTLIVGPLEILMRSMRHESDALQVSIIYRNANRLLQLINQLMDFSKLDGKRLKLEVTQFDIVKFTKTLSLSFMAEATQRHIDLKITTASEVVMGWLDRDKVENILFNVIGNAFKFTPDHGRIEISLSLYKEYKNNTAVRIRVVDSGLGIAPDSITRIFDRFYQAENSLNNHGTGIGLALAKELTELHGGEISVESELGLGATFSIIIPLYLNQPENFSTAVDEGSYFSSDTKLFDVPYSEQSEPISDKPHLLIIDDNADMRLFIRYEFNHDYTVSEASDGFVGFEKACNEIPDIIICDVMMPRIDGVTVCRKIRANMLTSHIPVILLTAKASDTYALEGLQSGANDYIFKPFNAAILKTKVRNLIALRDEVSKRFVKQPAARIQDISPTPLDEKFLTKAYEIVEKNLSNPNLDVDAFSIAIGMSRAQLYRKIQVLSGQSVKEFIRIIRLKKAAEMLLKSELNISQVAFDVGFSSVAYFTKSFSSYFGVTPSKYISINKNKSTSVR